MVKRSGRRSNGRKRLGFEHTFPSFQDAVWTVHILVIHSSQVLPMIERLHVIIPHKHCAVANGFPHNNTGGIFIKTWFYLKPFRFPPPWLFSFDIPPDMLVIFLVSSSPDLRPPPELMPFGKLSRFCLLPLYRRDSSRDFSELINSSTSESPSPSSPDSFCCSLAAVCA